MTQILLGVTENDADDHDKEQLALLLRSELLDLRLDIESVEPLSAVPPDGARSGLATVAGTLLATLSASHVAAVVVAVLGWLRRSPAERTARIEIDGDVLEVSNVDLETQARMIEAFLSRHTDRVGT